MPNNVSYFAINADDVPRAGKFYEAVFGWSFEP
jgi:predicted enzyme related to lactoylglutathione lyase